MFSKSFTGYYFTAISTILFVLSVLAFSDNLFTDIGQESNRDPKFIVHGLFMFAWYGTFIAQSYFILRKKIDRHIWWGKFGFYIAIGVAISTLWVFIAVFKGWAAMEPFVKVNRLFMLSFTIFLILAYRYRNNAAYHKRCIFWAIVLPIEPIMGRVSDLLLVNNWGLFYFLVWHAFFVSFLVYDWLALRRIHEVSIVALAWFYFSWAFALMSSLSESGFSGL